MFLFLLLIGLCALPAGAQGAYLEMGVNGFGMESRVVFAGGGFGGIGLTTGYSIPGVLDVGANVSAMRDQLGSRDATDLRVAFDYWVNVVKQSPGVPLSLQVRGSYGFNNVLSSTWTTTTPRAGAPATRWA